MANTPEKMQDPAEAALAAIQDALNLATEEGTKGTAKPAAQEPSKVQPARSVENAKAQASPVRVDDDLFADTKRADSVVAPSQPAANDDRRDIAQLLDRLSRRASATPLWIAFFISI